MDDDMTQQATQAILDPRRLGRNNSILSEADTSDVICILTPATPAAFKIVQVAAERSPGHVLQSKIPPKTESPELASSEAGTFIVNSQGSATEARHNGALDLALRFSTGTIRPYMGFCWGRNPNLCDILITVDTAKRISNSHFRIYLNDSGIIMLEDTSTNGTMVDDVLLKGKAPKEKKPWTRMLQSGSVIQILSTKQDEWIKFTVWIPPRGDFLEDYGKKFTKYMHYVEQDQKRFFKAKAENANGNANGGAEKNPSSAVARYHTRPTNQRNFGMHWDGSGIYNVVGLLGKGSFATVYSIAKAIDGNLLAAKELEKRRFIKNGRLDQRLDNEMKIMKTLRHPNIVQYIEYHDVNNHLYIIMEHVPCGDLQTWLSNNDVLPEDKAKRMARQILSSLGYLHQKQITHRDIKPDNILIASLDPFNVKLSDFGLSKVVKNNETFLKTFCGTLLYCAPEVFPHYETHNTPSGTKRRRGQSSKFHSYSQSVDIWSFAAVLWFALCGKPPFEGVMDGTGRGMFDKIMETKLDATDLRNNNVSDEGIDLLMRMLNVDPAARPSEKECLAHPWLGDGMVERMMPDYELDAIDEEDEIERDVAGEGADEAQAELSQLSIRDGGPRSVSRGRTYGVPSYDEDEEDIEAEDFEFLIESHQSKRVKTDLLFPRNQVRDQDPLDSSPEVSIQSFTRFRSHDASLGGPSHAPNARLFGEIGKSALQSSGLLGEHTSRALAINHSTETNNNTDHPGEQLIRTEPTSEAEMARLVDSANGLHAAASLLGAESLVRELNMASPQSGNSPAATNEPVTPQTPEPQPDPPSSHGQSQEETPKAAPVFNRQIILEKSPSFWYDPFDPSTHNLEYASERSGRDFVGEAAAAAAAAAASTTASTTRLGESGDEVARSTRSHSSAQDFTVEEAKSFHSAAFSQHTPEFIRPSPVYGKLTPTAESVEQTPHRLQHRTTSYGRLANCTIRWERKHSSQNSSSRGMDTRVSKTAFIIFFFPNDGEQKLKDAGDDWHNLPDLYTGILTMARNGIRINGVRLYPGDSNGQICFGKLYTGDIIEVFQDPSDGSCQRFKCEFFYGEAKNSRPPSEKFIVLKEKKGHGSQEGQPLSQTLSSQPVSSQ